MAPRLQRLLRLPRSGSSALARARLQSSVQPQPTPPPLWVNGVPPPRPPRALRQEAVPEAVPPRTLSTEDGYVRLPQDGCLDGYVIRQAAELRGLPTVLLNGVQKGDLEVVRQEIMAYFHATFTLFEKLHEVFAVSTAFFEKHERLRHPPIFYMGHTASFFVNKLHLGRFITERVDPVLEMQMAVGVDEMSWDDLDTSKYVWPSIEEAEADVASATAFLQKVMDFRRDVRALVHREMQRQPLEWPISRDSFWWVILMGIEHERIHLETSSVILRQARLEQVQDISKLLPQCRQGRFHPDPKSSVAQGTPANQLIPVPAGATRIGRQWQGTSTYGWDNEFGKPAMKEVPAFAASEFLVSNFEFLSFMEAGGYGTERWWSEEGWLWVKDMQPTAPRFWRACEGGGYRLRTLFEELPMPWDWPVECNHHEAAAFCKFLAERSGKSLRLPSECEAMRLRDAEPSDLQDSAHGPSWGRFAPGNVNLAHWGSPCPVDTFASASGHYDVLGNVWQHSLSPVDILEGFAAHPLYEDFTVPTVDGLHSRIMGGSWISSGAAGATRDSRFGFRRHFYQHAGFRYVESDREVATGVTPCERDKAVCNALRFHFDAPGDAFAKDLASAAVRALTAAGAQLATARALELGCGPGRTVLELAKLGVGAVHGADLTAKHFQLTSERLLSGGQLRWSNYLEGDLVEHRDLSCRELELEGREAAVQWHQIPDFAAVDTKKFKDYDLVLCAQPGALCASDPMGVLAGVHQLLKPGGVLVLGTQYEWPSRVEGLQNGKEVLSASLQPWFEELAEPEELPFKMAETARKFECGTQQLSFWRRRATQQDTRSAITQAPAPAAGSDAPQSMYESNEILSQYLEFHFGPESAYPAECAAACLAAAQELNVPLQRALEVGCGPGRAALELSKAFDHVDAGDSSRAFVEAAQKLLGEGSLRWRVVLDATAGKSVEREVTSQEVGARSVNFMELDAHELGAAGAGYDLICGFNLVDRLARPRDFLQTVAGRLNAGGLLVLSSPYTWLEDFTAKEAWLGGYKYGDNDGPSTYRGLKEFLMEQGLEEALAPKELWFRINELGNGRKSQQTRAQMTFWRRP